MPTFQTTPQFDRDWKHLASDSRTRFRRVVTNEFVPDLINGVFRGGLRVKGVEAAPNVFEMRSAPDGLATFSYGRSHRPGEPAVRGRGGS